MAVGITEDNQWARQCDQRTWKMLETEAHLGRGKGSKRNQLQLGETNIKKKGVQKGACKGRVVKVDSGEVNGLGRRHTAN